MALMPDDISITWTGGNHELVINHVRYSCSKTEPVEERQQPEPWRDIRDTMPTNASPDASELIAQRGGWWRRVPEQIDGITIHHTMSHSPQATASYCTKPKAAGGKGHATTQYHFWITAGGEALYCVDLTEGLWHDHTGDHNTHVSIGMAGSLHTMKPPRVQLEAAAEVTAYLMRTLNIADENVAGHKDWAMKVSGVKTVCPGWDLTGWRDDFFETVAVSF